MSNKTNLPHSEEIDCLEAIDNLYAYLDGELNDEEELNKFEQHLAHCRSCYSRAELEGVINKRLQEHGIKKTPESLQNRLHKLMDNF